MQKSPPLALRGPFKITGFIAPYWPPVIPWVQWLPIVYWDGPDVILMALLFAKMQRAVWIHYSRNISTVHTCH
jgi:hypothetical protein